jgi:O-antigen ligase
MTIAFPRWLADGALPFATVSVLLLALLFGGGTQQGFWSDTIIQLASLALLGVVLLSPNLVQVPRGLVILLCLLVALPVAQIIPLPPTLWTALPGREEVARAYSAASISLPWLPISLAPNITWSSVFSLLPAVAVFLAMLCLPNRTRRNLVLMMLAVTAVSVLLDLLQMMGGLSSPLRFYAITNIDRAVGFFANANHNAAFLYCAIPFTAVWGIELRRQPGRLLVVALLLGLTIIGLAITQSRAGLILSVIAALSCIPLVVGKGRGISRRRLLGAVVGGGVIALLIAFQFGFVGMAQRMQGDAGIFENLRWSVASVTFKAAQANLPFGAGFGTFVPVYQTVEPRTLLMEPYINRAHNDWLELGLEGGVLAIVGLLIFFVWFGRSSFQAWRPANSDAHALDTALARAGSIVIVLLMLHSIVDYPLRTTAMMVVFALACALLISPKDPKIRPIQVSKPSDLPLSISSMES